MVSFIAHVACLFLKRKGQSISKICLTYYSKKSLTRLSKISLTISSGMVGLASHICLGLKLETYGYHSIFSHSLEKKIQVK